MKPRPSLLLRLVRLAAGLLMAAIVAVTAAQQSGSFGPWWLELSRYLPYHFILAPGAVAVLLSHWLSWRWKLASVAAFVLLCTVTMGLSWSNGDAPASGDTRLRFMTYNVKAIKASQRGDGVAELAREVALHKPDLLVMQDADGLPVHAVPGPLRRAPVFGLPEVVAVGQYVVASRFPLHDCTERRLPLEGGAFHYLRCTVSVDGHELTVATPHFVSPRTGLEAARFEGLDGTREWRQNHELRLRQSHAIAADLKDVHRPLIVAGDLNAIESSPVLRPLLSIGLRDAFSSAGRGYGYTYGQALRLGFSFLRIDHILVSPEIGVTHAYAGGGEASDHRPVIADLLLRSSAQGL
ncbi:MAG: Endonuclease/exonuclease/phosphatase [Rhizobacter sp.]|nr:Endonuclease/exonuclease/phosphatase [Rhizobacter sp.]